MLYQLSYARNCKPLSHKDLQAAHRPSNRRVRQTLQEIIATLPAVARACLPSLSLKDADDRGGQRVPCSCIKANRSRGKIGDNAPKTAFCGERHRDF